MKMKRSLAIALAACMAATMLASCKKEEPAPAPAPRLCPFCCQPVDDKATRGHHCTSELPEEEKK